MMGFGVRVIEGGFNAFSQACFLFNLKLKPVLLIAAVKTMKQANSNNRRNFTCFRIIIYAKKNP